MIKGSDQNEFRSRYRSFGAGFIVLRKRLMFDARAGIAEPFGRLSSNADLPPENSAIHNWEALATAS